jgi:hypothetical protein
LGAGICAGSVVARLSCALSTYLGYKWNPGLAWTPEMQKQYEQAEARENLNEFPKGEFPHD